MGIYFAYIKRWSAIITYLIYFLLQVYLVDHIKISRNDNSFLLYSFKFTNGFVIGIEGMLIILIIPFILSYLIALISIRNRNDMVQIIGPKSLMKRIEMEFHSGNPEGIALNDENVSNLLHEMAEGEPIGTYENLEMLLKTGIEVTKLINKSRVKSIKKVYVTNEEIPNAFTFRFIPLPFIGEDWIIINKNVMDLLSDSEVRAVIAHEIGHAAKYDSWINSLLYSPRLTFIVVWAYIFAEMAGAIFNNPFQLNSFLRLIILLVFLGVIRLLMAFGGIFTNHAYRQAELIADYYAANLVGTEAIANALVKIGQRGEVIKSILLTVDELNQRVGKIDSNEITFRLLNLLNPGEKSRKLAEKSAVEWYVYSTLGKTFKALRLNIDKDMLDKMAQISISNILNELDERQRRQISDLNNKKDELNLVYNYDFDGDLDKKDLIKLASELKAKKGLMNENEVLEKMGIIPKSKIHPSMSDRIIFLSENLLEKNKND